MNQNGAKSNQNVRKLRRKNPKFFGFLLFVFAVYLMILCIQLLTKEHISVYEVTKKQIADDETIRGMILRDEVLVTTDQSGYINYYVGDGTKIGAKTTIYSIDETGDISKQLFDLEAGEIALSDDQILDVRNTIRDYRASLSLSDYDLVKNFQYDMENIVLELTSNSLSKRVDKIIKEGGEQSTFQVVKSKNAGIVAFNSDGLEHYTVNNLTSEQFVDMSDHWKPLRSEEKIEAGAPVYRLIRSEYWSIVIPLTESQSKKLSTEKNVKVTLKKDNLQLSVPITKFKIGQNEYAKLDFDKYMIRYVNNRYLDIQLQFNQAKGLKVPVSSILEKECYVIPKSYITKGSEEGGGGTGVFLRKYNSNGEPERYFTSTEIYYEDDNEMVYIDKNLFPPGTQLIPSADSQMDNYEVSQTSVLLGVYNCNQGYCRFQVIEKLYENEEYAIIQDDTIYGPSIYDHIILNPDMIDQDDILY